MPLQHLFRPKTFDEFYGNSALKDSLLSVLNRKDDIPKSYLFTGPSGCGKTTLGYLVRDYLGISKENFYEYDTANTRGIDTIRQIIESSTYLALGEGKKMYLFDECHALTLDAKRAMLKLLEDPPDHVYLILCTTDPGKLDTVVKRRCFPGEVKALHLQSMKVFLNKILKAEEFPDFPASVIDQIAENCEGSPGVALNILDAVIDTDDPEKAMSSASGVSVTEAIHLCRALVARGSNRWTKVQKVISTLEGDPEAVRRIIISYMCTVLINSPSDFIAYIASFFVDNFIEKFLRERKHDGND